MMVGRRARRLLLLPAIAVIPPSVAHPQAIRDSAGVRIVTVDLTRPAETLRLTARPIVDIGGGATESEQLFRVSDVARLRMGLIAIANGGTGQIKLFDTTGRLVRQAGRKGQGPGEFQSMSGLWTLPGDTIVVADGSQRRLVFFDGALNHLRTVSLVTPPDTRHPGTIDIAGRTMLAATSNVTTMPPRAEPYYFTQDLWVYGIDGKPVRRVGTFGDGEHFVQTTRPENGGVAYWDRTFGRRTTMRAVGDDIVIGDGTTWELRRIDRTGALRAIVRANQTPPPVTAAHRAAIRAAELAGVKPEDRAIEERRLAEMPYPERFPAFQRFEIDPEGRIWVKRYPKPGDIGESWSVIGGDGRYLAEVTLPPRVRLRTVGTHWIACTAMDADDVERVQVYGITTNGR